MSVSLSIAVAIAKKYAQTAMDSTDELRGEIEKLHKKLDEVINNEIKMGDALETAPLLLFSLKLLNSKKERWCSSNDKTSKIRR